MAQIPLARIHGVNDVRLDKVAVPECGPDDVVIAVKQCGICGTDLGFLAMGGLMGPGAPLPIGHEFWGLVDQVGANVSHVFQGQRVVVQPVLDDLLIGNGGPQGAFTPYIQIPGVASNPAAVLPLHDSMPDAYGALVEPLAVAQHGANRVSAVPGDCAVIFGAGPIGISLLMVLQYRGLENIVVVDLSARRLALAEALGATAVHGDADELQQTLIDRHGRQEFFGMPMPASSVYFEATGVRQVFETIVSIAGPGSRICLTGVHKEPVSMDLVMMLAKELSVIAASAYENEFSEVMAMLQSGDIDPTVMISHEYSLSDLDQAFAIARDQGSAIKVIINCQE